MEIEEIVKRLRHLVDLPPDKRPISVHKLGRVAGVQDHVIYKIHKNGTMQPKTKVRMEKALTWLENGMDEQQPKQVIVRRVTFTSKGPRISMVTRNPLALTPLDPFGKQE